MSDRENYIQVLCKAILDKDVEDTGDYGTGAQCPFCYQLAPRWNADLHEVKHASNCAYLIAKDLSTNLTPTNKED